MGDSCLTLWPCLSVSIPRGRPVKEQPCRGTNFRGYSFDNCVVRFDGDWDLYLARFRLSRSGRCIAATGCLRGILSSATEEFVPISLWQSSQAQKLQRGDEACSRGVELGNRFFFSTSPGFLYTPSFSEGNQTLCPKQTPPNVRRSTRIVQDIPKEGIPAEVLAGNGNPRKQSMER